MSWDLEWNSIENQIQEFDRLCSNYINTMGVKSEDVFGVVKNIIFPSCKELLERIELYKERYHSILSVKALESIEALLIQFQGHLENSATSVQPGAILFYKEKLNKLAFDFNYYTKELDGSVFRKSERAFIHLQRTLVVNSNERKLWKDAFNTHETIIEGLGAAHLLLHGIWAFKIDSGGQRTDLVFEEKFSDSTLGEVRTASEGLVLTEWKLVKNPKDTNNKSMEAHKQAKIYSAESLAELELRKYRYLVMVSLKQLEDLPEDFTENGIKYRYVNIAIEPENPSTRSRKR